MGLHEPCALHLIHKQTKCGIRAWKITEHKVRYMCDFMTCVTCMACVTCEHDSAWLRMTPHDSAWLRINLHNFARHSKLRIASHWPYITPYDPAWLRTIPHDSAWLRVTHPQPPSGAWRSSVTESSSGDEESLKWEEDDAVLLRSVERKDPTSAGREGPLVVWLE